MAGPGMIWPRPYVGTLDQVSLAFAIAFPDRYEPGDTWLGSRAATTIR
jgi:hypothetical protein